ncbi:MAG: hypothetical protein QG652_1558, partial [Pseudomonadota bacterium]|nr:hypothetical protein [Pseudomonadota bacterium]
SGSDTGTLNLQITDAPVDDAQEVVIEFTGVEIKAADGETIVITYDTPKQINLLALTGGVAETIVDNQTLPAGQVEWIRLEVNEANSHITIDDAIYGLTIPSSAQTGLKLNRPITIAEGGTASFTIDFDLRKSVHERQENNYMLRPTLRLIDNHTDGALHGTVASTTVSENCMAGDKAAVYVYAGNVTADDVGSTVEPITTASIDLANADADYTVAFIPAGNYTAAFTCDAGQDDATTDDDITFAGTQTVVITAGLTTEQDF